MAKYELTISPDYVPEWTIVEAVRELFQNALDQQTANDDNPMFFDYDGHCRLFIGNKRSALDVSSLLLGKTSKAGDDRMVGKYGEGYKIATLVLLRLGKQITFYNYGKREVWRARFINSRRFGSQILTFDIDRKHVWQCVPDNDLTIVVEGLEPTEYAKIVATNLHLQGLVAIENTPSGRILLDENQQGRVYVNGLFVCEYKPYVCGYDFKPSSLRLDRDRRLVSDFDLKWLASSLWSFVGSEKIADMAAMDAPDVAYLSSNHWEVPADKVNKLYDYAHAHFLQRYGADAVPISSSEEAANLPANRKPVYVSTALRYLVTNSSLYSRPRYIEKVNWADRMEEWFEDVRDRLPGDDCARFEVIMEGIKRQLVGEE